VVPALLTATLLYTIYLVSINGYYRIGGLYLTYSESIIHNGFIIPPEVPHYTADGVIFAYPPLVFYIIGGFETIGFDPLTVARYFPGFMHILSVFTFFVFVRKTTGDSRIAGLSSVAIASSPLIVQNHLFMSGIVRGFGFLIVLIGALVGISLARRPNWILVICGSITFGAALLSHPFYSVFFVATYLSIYIVLDRSKTGFYYFSGVGIGGLILALPWLILVLSRFGLDPFQAASQANNTTFELAAFVGNLSFIDLVGISLDARPEMLILVGTVLLLINIAWMVGAYYDVSHEKGFFTIWLLLTGLLNGRKALLFVIQAPLFAFFANRYIAPAIAKFLSQPELPVFDDYEQTLSGLFVVLVLLGTVGGCLLTGYYISSKHPTVTSGDVNAMDWAKKNTGQEETFMVVGYGAEWFPYFSDRTVITAPWGMEWESPHELRQHAEALEGASTASSVRQFEDAIGEIGTEPDYIYIPKGIYLVGLSERKNPELINSFNTSDRYTIVYENERAIIYQMGKDAKQ